MRVVGRGAVDLVEQAVLQRRGVLEFIDQRHRVLGQDALTQHGTVVAGQGRVQALQHVGKAEAAGLALEVSQPLRHARGRMQAHGHADGRQLLQLHQQRLQLGQLQRHEHIAGRSLEGLGQAFGAEAVARGLG